MLRYRETGELHKDFHGSMNAAVEYVGSRYGLDGLRAVFRATAQRFYRSIYEGLTPSELFCDQTVLLNEAWCQGTPFEAVSEQQEMHCLELFKAQGLAGMKAYWDRIAVEENCDMTCTLYDDRLEINMNRCPSLSKAMDNDAGAFPRYCDHCPGWVIPLLEKAGYQCEYDMIDRAVPQCRMTIYPADPARPSRVLVSGCRHETER